jgi:hypothetical protein
MLLIGFGLALLSLEAVAPAAPRRAGCIRIGRFLRNGHAGQHSSVRACD